jgi:membrane protease subunit HflK
MAWNEPGGGNKDPWTNHKGNQDPPDLDEIVRNLQNQIGRLFGGGNHGSGSEQTGKGWWGLLLGLLLFGWIITGIYIIQPAERGVVLRFGSYTGYLAEPGPHWHIPWPVERVEAVNVDEISSFKHTATMLTQDENIVDVELTVQSRIQNAADFLFQDQNPKKTLRDATETVVRKTIGENKLDFILTEGRGVIAISIQERVQSLMDQYKTGLLVTSVNTQPAKPPEQVKEAFDDAIKAREDKERLENKAEAYANEILPQARGEAARALADAKAYRDEIIASAEGETARFLAILKEYQKAPLITRERFYIETVESVLRASTKLFIDVPNGSSLMYLPLDQLLNNAKNSAQQHTQAQPNYEGTATRSAPSAHDLVFPSQLRDVMRERRIR